MKLYLGIGVSLASVYLVLLQGWFAYKDRFLTPNQMISWGTAGGLPFGAHGGMYSDLFLLSPLLGIIAGEYYNSWTVSTLGIALILAAVISGLLHMVYLCGGGIPEAHVRNMRMMRPGYIHCFYMTGALALIILFYFYTPNKSPVLTLWLSVSLVLHTILTNHMVLWFLKWLKPRKYPWYSNQLPQKRLAWIMIAVVAVILGWRTALVFVNTLHFTLLP